MTRTEYQRRQRQARAASPAGQFIATLGDLPRDAQIIGQRLALDLGPQLDRDFYGLASLTRRVPYSRSTVDRAWRKLRESGRVSYWLRWRQAQGGGWRSYIRGLKLWRPVQPAPSYVTVTDPDRSYLDSISSAKGGRAPSRAGLGRYDPDDSGYDATGCLV